MSIETELIGCYIKENAELKELLLNCIKDMYKPSGKICKATALKLMKYIADNNIQID